MERKTIEELEGAYSQIEDLNEIAKQIDNIRGSLTYLVQNYRG